MSFSDKGSSKDKGPGKGLLMGCLRKIVCIADSGLKEAWEEEGSCVRNPGGWMTAVSPCFSGQALLNSLALQFSIFLHQVVHQ